MRSKLHVEVADGSKTLTFIVPVNPKMNDLENIERAREYFDFVYDVLSVKLVGEYKTSESYIKPGHYWVYPAHRRGRWEVVEVLGDQWVWFSNGNMLPHEDIKDNYIWSGPISEPPIPDPPHTCPYCGAPSHVDPGDAAPPPDYCHEEDHEYA
jgi:hypothetical protein